MSSIGHAQVRHKILIVDDQVTIIAALFCILEQKYEVFQATSGLQALEFCPLHQPDLIILDVHMPDMDGHEVCMRLKDNPLTRDIPVIFITSQNDPADEARALELGAVDFISKPVNTVVVNARVATHLRIRMLEQELRQLAFYDVLTKLPNRRLLMDRLHKAILDSKRNQRSAALLFLDLNKFKVLNDTHGHEIGDLFLIEIAARIRKVVRQNDTVSRFGGDEFVILLEGLDQDLTLARGFVRAIEDKIHQTLDADYIFGAVTHRCTVSIGAQIFMGDAEKAGAIIRAADLAMYQEKRQTRQER